MDRIADGELDKVVLAHDLLAVAEEDIDVRAVLAGLAARNPDCWTFAVAGLVGATPELLVSRTGDQVFSRVLAGTAARGGDPADDQPRVDALLHSAKDGEEHRYAVESLVGGARPARPRPATCRRRRTRSSCRTSPTSRPTSPPPCRTARTCSTWSPRSTRRLRSAALRRRLALEALADLEGMDRGRYAGPVGWVDARGDGEWGIALRCAQLDGPIARDCSPAAASSPAPTPTPRCSRRRPSWCRCATPSRARHDVQARAAAGLRPRPHRPRTGT